MRLNFKDRVSVMKSRFLALRAAGLGELILYGKSERSQFPRMTGVV